jgi:lactoylglutathione lyase
VRTLHFGLRVADVDRSLAFYRAVGYEVVGSVADTPLGDLTMLKLPGDEFVTIELVAGPVVGVADAAAGLSHFVIQVESLDAAIAALAAHGIHAEPPHDAAPPGTPHTTMISDPDGNDIELVEWPAGHAAGMSAADWPA